MQVPDATMRVAHTFQVVRKEKVSGFVHHWDIYYVPCCFDYCRANPETWPYLHLKFRVQVMLRLLITSAVLRQERWGDTRICRGCCQHLTIGRCGWRWGSLRRDESPWEDDHCGSKITRSKSPLQALEFWPP